MARVCRTIEEEDRGGKNEEKNRKFLSFKERLEYVLEYINRDGSVGPLMNPQISPKCGQIVADLNFCIFYF